MGFKVGDNVLVLDEDLWGVVKKVTVNSITIETTDGFELDFEKHELVINNFDNTIKAGLFLHSSAKDVILQKEQPTRKKQQRVKTKARYEPIMEVDLHINKLVKSSKGMSNYDILSLQLDTAKRQLEFALQKRIQKMVFIHGVGEGVLKMELDFLFARYNNVKSYDANYRKYGVGATEVYILQNTASNI